MRKKDNYTFTVTDIARITAQEVNTVRQHIHRGKFNPAELESVVEYINSMRGKAPDSQLGYIQLLEQEARSENVFKKDLGD